jgi:hypothetical protein
MVPITGITGVRLMNILQKTMLAAGVAMFVAAPASAEPLDIGFLYGDTGGSTKASASVKKCGKESDKNLVTSIELEPTGPFNGAFFMGILGDFVGAEGPINGRYIEAQPNKKMSMAMDEDDYIALVAKLNVDVDIECPGFVIVKDYLEIKKFEGKLSKNSSRLKVKFDSKFEVEELESDKTRKGTLKFDSKFDNLVMAPIQLP